MAKLIFSKAKVLNTSSAVQMTISNITVEGVEIEITPDTVNIENNRELFESYTGRIVVRTTNINNDAGSAILASAFVSNDGTTPTEGKLQLVGQTGSHTITTGNTFIMGHKSFENGRLETVLVAQAAATDSESVLVVS
tara:strand:+ start:879 stop:1292 length:414 start_codon:yes stop_codon:yes gene_type:complete